MSFFNFDLFGVYVAPLAFLLLICAGAWWFLRHLLDALGVLPLIWHPALFFAAIYAMLASGSLLLLLQRPLLLWNLFGIER